MAPQPGYQPFPFPYADTYDSSALHKPAVFHADNGGTFEIAESSASGDGTGDSGRELLQAVPAYNASTAWVHSDYDPITSLGATDWTNYDVTLSVQPVGTPPDYALADPVTMASLPTSTGTRPAGAKESTLDPIARGAYGGVCVRQIDQYNTGYCLLLGRRVVVPSFCSILFGLIKNAC